MDQLSNYPHLKWYVSNLRSIPGGSYLYGASPSQKQSGTRITMSPFKMGATPVTWGMWKEYKQSIGVPGKMKLQKDPGWGYPDDHPVVKVSWLDITEPGGFAEWASKIAGFQLALPTDAQWEYAARGGKDGLDYPWGNELDTSRFWANKGLFDREVEQTAAVDRSYRIYRNGYGLTDMVGNVHEWCADYFNSNYRPLGKDPFDKKESFKRCVRSASYLDGYEQEPELFRCAFRTGTNPRLGGDLYSFGTGGTYGFRLSAGSK